MLELDEARQRISRTLPTLPIESVALVSALGRVVAEDVIAQLDLPRVDNSAMDGYAVIARDITGAGPETPVSLRMIGQAAAGDVFEGTLLSGACVRVFTGSPLPAGTDAVVMQEDTRVEPGRPGAVQFLDGAKPWENVRLRGEDVKQGGRLVAAGQRLSAGHLGLLAATGVHSLPVHRRPVVALLATGSELVEPAEGGRALPPGKIFESNRLVLASLLQRGGMDARIQPLVPDTLEATRDSLGQAFADADVVITSGGVSVGELDFVKRAFEELGGVLEFWKVFIKPGKPFVFGRWKEKFLFGLPGNPVSAVVTFLLLVRPALWRLQGATDVLPEKGTCLLAEELRNPGERREFVRVFVDGEGRARSSGAQASHLLLSLANANALVEVPPRSTLAEGTILPIVYL